MNYKSKQLLERCMEVVFLLSALASIIAVLLICVFMFAGGLPAIGKIGLFNFLGGTEWNPVREVPDFGILPMIVGSVYITAGSVLVGIPIGLLTAVFMARFCNRRLYAFIKPVVNLLAGIPSIVYGFFGMVVIVPLVRQLAGGTGKSILTASILLGIMILPTVINISESAIRAVPQLYYEGALALGATHERAVFTVLLPAAKSGVFASVVLGVGRAIGETMAVIMVAGNQPRITTNFLKGIRTLTANIVLEMGYSADLHREALLATGVVLFVFILIINTAFSILQNRREQRSR